MCFENIINWRRLTYISVSVCIKINKIISLQIDLIVLHCQGWSLDRDKFQPIAHSRDELFNTSHFKAEINTPIQCWMETTISIPSTSKAVSSPMNHRQDGQWLQLSGLIELQLIVSLSNLTLAESLMNILCKRGSWEKFPLSGILRTYEISIWRLGGEIVKHLLITDPGHYKAEYSLYQS